MALKSTNSRDQCQYDLMAVKLYLKNPNHPLNKQINMRINFIYILNMQT
jgi:hypothetical protein